MKTLFLATLLCHTALSYAQTTPGATPAVAGTKNVGADRADAPQAPGMQAPTPSAGRMSGTKTGRRGTKQSKPTPAAPKQ